jgi:hypothetical protein
VSGAWREKVAALRENEEKQNSGIRIQEPELKKTESVNVVSALYSDF